LGFPYDRTGEWNSKINDSHNIGSEAPIIIFHLRPVNSFNNFLLLHIFELGLACGDGRYIYGSTFYL
jgi:hypothetical protein